MPNQTFADLMTNDPEVKSLGQSINELQALLDDVRKYGVKIIEIWLDSGVGNYQITSAALCDDVDAYLEGTIKGLEAKFTARGEALKQQLNNQ